MNELTIEKETMMAKTTKSAASRVQRSCRAR